LPSYRHSNPLGRPRKRGSGPEGADPHLGKCASAICLYLRSSAVDLFYLCAIAALRENFSVFVGGRLAALAQLRATFLGDEQEQDDEIE
jgi:hypothetical protein